MPRNRRRDILEAVLLGSIEWQQASRAAHDLARMLSAEIDAICVSEIKDAYSPTAWVNVCRQLRVVTDGMVTMRLLQQGKTPQDICRDTGITVQTIAAYKAWNTMYARAYQARIKATAHNAQKSEQMLQTDVDWLRSIGISISEGA